MDNLRPFLYVSLVFLLFLIWQAWNQDYVYTAHVEPAAVGELAASAEDGAPPVTREDLPEAAIAEGGAVPQGEIARTSTRIRVVTDVLDIEIDTRGGDILRTDLPTYPVSLKTPDAPIRLLDAEGRGYIAQSGLIHDRTGVGDEGNRAPSHHAVYRVDSQEYRLAPGVGELIVPLVWEGPDGITVTKRYTFRRGDFLFDVEHIVENAADRPWVGRQYRQLRHGPAGGRESWFLYTYTGPAFYDDKYQKLPFDDMAAKPLDRQVVGGWIATLQHYFLSAWLPDAEENNLFYTRVIGGNTTEYLVGMRSAPLTVEPGGIGAFHSRFYVGPKLQVEMAEIAKGLELTADYGLFTVLAKPVFWLLRVVYDLIGNWGWAIVIVTLLIKLSFYKLSEASYRSMARMRAVQPKLMALKERCGDDKQRMNQEMMELYRKEKINPLGGCLPMIIQIPVFIALYWVLLESVEMRQAPWILWINDLSTRDPYFVLPLLMGITMFIQQKLNPAPMDPIQAKVFMALPFVFTVFFAFFPAGLVLYWFMNSLLSIAQQWYIIRGMELEAKKAG